MKNRFAMLLAVLLTAAGCAPSYRGEFQKLADREQWTTEQKRAALEYSYRYFGKEQEGGAYTVLYSRLPKSEVTAQLDSFLSDLDELLNYRNESDREYLETFGLRPHFEQQEEVFRAIRARIRVAELHDVFEQMLGKRSYYSSSRDEHGFDHAMGYDPAILAIDPAKLGERFPFRNEVIDEAKKEGLLREVARFSLTQRRDLAFKEPDPDDPEDPNKYVWRKQSYELEMVSYKIITPGDEKPRDNNTNYAEVYRLIGGKREDKPAIRAFLDGSGSTAIAVIDTQRQSDTTGYGLPDSVERIPESRLADAEMVARIFPDDPRIKRIQPKDPPVRVEIAKAGTEIDIWEKATTGEGWRVPFPYRNEEGDNYTVALRFKKKKHGQGDGPAARLREVEYIEKRWKPTKPCAGDVVEYFVPKDPFGKPVLAGRVVEIYNLPTKLEFVFPDGTEETIVVTPGPNKAVRDKPEAVGYDFAGKRYVIKDEDGNGSYEKRKEVGELSAGAGRWIHDFGDSGTYHADPVKPEEQKQQ